MLLSDGTSIQTRTVVWAGGLMASPLAANAGLPRGHGGRIEVQPDLTVEGFPGVYVLGDFANIPGADGQPLPQLGSVAQQCGEWTAKNILAEIAGKTRTAVPLSRQGNHGDDRTRRGRGGNREEETRTRRPHRLCSVAGRTRPADVRRQGNESKPSSIGRGTISASPGRFRSWIEAMRGTIDWDEHGSENSNAPAAKTAR